jgi:DNA-binding XRE family transcriptional regulator
MVYTSEMSQKLSNVLREIREKRNISTRQLGKMLDVSGQTISRIENEDIKEPAEYIKRIWRMLDDDEKEAVKQAWIALALEKIK